jgi:molybdenum cofactor cytidylyltransferase
MKFGPVPVHEAEGALLAHSLRLPSGRLRKGHRLTPEDIVLLQEAGVPDVTVARLEPGDMLENDAADVLAAAVHGGALHLSLSAPFTGRVNIVADRPGLVRIDASKITEANKVDPMITVATVPPNHQIHPGGMVATIKIISYAAPTSAVHRAAEIARGAVKLATPIYDSVSLIITEVAGGPGLKGQEAIRDRVLGLGMTLTETVAVRHEEEALSTALSEAKGDMIFVLTASATSDEADTAPMALERAGGTLTRFGIPVDPGNLLFFGTLGKKPVIGLPGSARSPVLHGADWILVRVACGHTPDADSFAQMGVGGLLKEIPTRPQPRHRGNPK